MARKLVPRFVREVFWNEYFKADNKMGQKNPPMRDGPLP